MDIRDDQSIKTDLNQAHISWEKWEAEDVCNWAMKLENGNDFAKELHSLMTKGRDLPTLNREQLIEKPYNFSDATALNLAKHIMNLTKPGTYSHILLTNKLHLRSSFINSKLYLLSALEQDLKKRTVFIKMTTQKRVYGYGTGILIGKRYVITAKHVAMPVSHLESKTSFNLFKRDTQPGSLYIGLNYPTTRWAMARFLGHSNDHDLALLEIIDNDVPDLSILPTPLLGEVCETQDVLIRSFSHYVLLGTNIMDPGLPTIPPPIQCIKRGYISYWNCGIIGVDSSSDIEYHGAGVMTTTGKLCGVIKGWSEFNPRDIHCESYHHFVPFIRGS
ncbi:hypothetical protein DFA_02593 [Cavenderia fasciculata]|uniref:Peptidase S1 domain-containing protein n=1 Tax=Cavenderia fasciculata TaxID=261658 RepID=F4PZU0_CACFS|nr:uncharacterized protein DFA_02593 [Cavenderia fasciculata]EGG18854.1 hypothetical protein DFA_02593 [Cavenderia fasciculata]|eukprot:XP_004357316.1 hypothetical protein DFA_02593 [Cavenderia fasciculata]